MAVHLYRLMLALLSCKARTTAITKDVISFLRNSHCYMFLLTFKWYFSLKKVLLISHPNLAWNILEQFWTVKTPSSQHLSPSCLEALCTAVPHLAPIHSPATGPTLVLAHSCWNASGTSTILCSLHPAWWPRGHRDRSQPRSVLQGIASPWVQRKPREQGKKAWSKDLG